MKEKNTEPRESLGLEPDSLVLFVTFRVHKFSWQNVKKLKYLWKFGLPIKGLINTIRTLGKLADMKLKCSKISTSQKHKISTLQKSQLYSIDCGP